VAFVPRKSKSKTEIGAPNVPGRAQRLALFGPPPLLEGEDAAIYDQILAHICVAVKPVDIIDEMYIADAVHSEWEVLRYHRLKRSLIQARGLELLRGFLAENLDDDLCSGHFADDLAEILEENLPEDQADSAQTLAHKCARNEADAVDKVNEVLDGIEQGFFGIRPTMDSVLSEARTHKAKALVQEYVRREPDAVTLVNELLTGAGQSMDDFMAAALAYKLDDIERIDRLISIAESRRNASLRELDRRRPVLGETVRRSVQEIEDGEFKEIEAMSAKGKNAA
jgi:hypothetical protein